MRVEVGARLTGSEPLPLVSRKPTVIISKALSYDLLSASRRWRQEREISSTTKTAPVSLGSLDEGGGGGLGEKVVCSFAWKKLRKTVAESLLKKCAEHTVQWNNATFILQGDKFKVQYYAELSIKGISGNTIKKKFFLSLFAFSFFRKCVLLTGSLEFGPSVMSLTDSTLPLKVGGTASGKCFCAHQISAQWEQWQSDDQ